MLPLLPLSGIRVVALEQAVAGPLCTRHLADLGADVVISCAISGYGSEGPYRDRKAYDLLIQAESAVTDVTGTPGSPAKVGISIADIGAGLYACMSILAALRLRDKDDEGRRIDVSLFDSLAEWMTVPAYHQMYGGKPPPRTGVRHATIVPYGPYRCADGEVMLAVQNEGQWDRLCRNVLRRPALAKDPRFLTNELRVRARETLEPLIEEALLALSRSVAEERLSEGDVPFAARNTVAEFVAHQQLAARGRWAEVATPGGEVRALVPPFNISGVTAPMGPVPALDQHGREIRREVSR